MDIKMNFFKREKIEFFLFGCSLFLYLFFSILSSSFYYRYFGGFYFNCLIVLCILLLLIKEIIHCFFSPNDVFFLSISIFVFFIVFRQVGLGVAGFIPFVFSARTIKITRVLKIIMYTCTLTLIFIVASSKLGVIENYFFYDGRLRHYLGFRYSLYPSAIFFNITAIYVFLKKRKISLYGILMLLGLNFYFYFQTKSILSFVSAVCLLFFSFIGKFINFEKLRKFKVMFFLSFSYVYLFCISVFLCYEYRPTLSWMYNLDSVWEGRMSYANSSLKEFGVHLFGSSVVWKGNELDYSGSISIGKYLFVDNFYVNILQQFGIVLAILIVLLLTIAMLESYKKKDYYLFFILLLFSCHGLIDNLMFTPYYNAFLFVIGSSYVSSSIKFKKSETK